MSISIAEAILEGAHMLRKAGVPEARREAGSLLAFILEKDRSFIITHATDSIEDDQLLRYKEGLSSRAQGMPLQYITESQEFFGLEFEVNQNVLIPRPETELLIEEALKLIERDNAAAICDVGTGSGCIGITLLHERPMARAMALDVSPEALAVAQRNASRHQVGDRIEFVLSDCFAAIEERKPTFDLIVSNPPYVADSALEGLQREVRDFEPRVALAAGDDGLDVIRRLLNGSQAFLRPGGHLLFEMGFDQQAAVEKLIDASVWQRLNIYQDLQGIPRTVALKRIV